MTGTAVVSERLSSDNFNSLHYTVNTKIFFSLMSMYNFKIKKTFINLKSQLFRLFQNNK